jgi:hypothetical protein
MSEPETRIVMRPPPGFSFWRAAILAGGLFVVVFPAVVAIALLVGGAVTLRGSDDAAGIPGLIMMAGYFLFGAFIWFCIIDRRLPRMEKTALSSQPQNSGREPTK